MAHKRLSESANIISHNTQIVEKYTTADILFSPSFNTHSSSDIELANVKAAEARCAAVEAINELRCLMLGLITGSTFAALHRHSL